MAADRYVVFGSFPSLKITNLCSLPSLPSRFALKDLKAQCEAVAMRNISTANVAAMWSDLRKCAAASPDLHAYSAYLIVRNWNVLASTKMVSDMAASDILILLFAFLSIVKGMITDLYQIL
jgi:hypothetical protein